MDLLKKIVKLVLAAVIYYSGMLALFSIVKRLITHEDKFIILMYHRILNDDEKHKADIQAGISITRSTFDKHMQFIAKHYQILSLEKLTDVLLNKQPFPRKTAVVTFDDGWRDNYINGLPIFKKHGIPAMIFLATDLIEANELPPFIEVSLLLGEGDLWREKAVKIFKKAVHDHGLEQSIEGFSGADLDLIESSTMQFMIAVSKLDTEHIKLIADELKKESGLNLEDWENRRWMLNRDEIREMNQQGIDFGSHGQSHDIMTEISRDQVRRELIESKKYIEAIIEKPVLFFAYPVGFCNDEIKNLVRDTGYRGAAAIHGCGKNEKQPDLYALKRIGTHEGTAAGPAGGFSRAIFACNLEKIF
jgi:peptidoglycan/xylan/chitin deacetylase (PgdA/CDA1 family)